MGHVDIIVKYKYILIVIIIISPRFTGPPLLHYYCIVLIIGFLVTIWLLVDESVLTDK